MKLTQINVKPYFPKLKYRKSMVKWFSPSILLKTLKDLVLSKIVGSQVDTRELQSVNESNDSNLICKFGDPYQSDRNGDFYFDFIADTGDGWNSTYSIASLLSRDALVVKDKSHSDTQLTLPRGEFLLLGGDEIYPSPSEKMYHDRFLKPYKHAWDWLWLNDEKNIKDKQEKRQDLQNNRRKGSFLPLDKQPDIYAIPGNHDWYDSLIAFRKTFCNVFMSNKIGNWKTNQSRSYFALNLPHNWIVLAFDFGLDQYNIDGLQQQYFQHMIQNLDSDSKLIILAAEPLWVYGGVQKKKLNQAYQDIEQMIEDIFSEKNQPTPKIYLNLSGDTHNYQRYERMSGDKLNASATQCSNNYNCTQEQFQKFIQQSESQHQRQYIVAGGGGAFLHPTHSTTQQNMQIIPNQDYSLGEYADNPHISEVTIKDMFELKQCYPDIKTSKRLSSKLLFSFLSNNIRLGFFIATVYLVLAWPMRAFLDSVIIQKQLNGFADSGLNFLTIVISGFVIAGFTLWARSRPGKALTLAGLVHGSLQALLLYGGYVLVYLLMTNLWKNNDLQYGWFLFPITRDIVYFIFISIFSPLLLALALWVYLTYFKANQNDLFGSGSIDAFKHLIRLKIDNKGRLIIYPIAVDNMVSYSMPEENEMTKTHLDLLKKHNGENWDNVLSCAPNKQNQLKPKKINYFLIEEPIIIDPSKDYSANTS